MLGLALLAQCRAWLVAWISQLSKPMVLIALCLCLSSRDPRDSLVVVVVGLSTTYLDHPVAGQVGAPSAPKGLGSTAQHAMTVTPRQPITFGGCWLFNRVPKNQWVEAAGGEGGNCSHCGSRDTWLGPH